MCGSLFSTPDVPDVTAPPTEDTSGSKAGNLANERRRLAGRTTRQSTVLASANGNQDAKAPSTSNVMATGTKKKLGE